MTYKLINITISLFLLFPIISIGQIYLGSHHIEHLEGDKKSMDKNKWKSETKKENTLFRNLSFDIKFDDNCKYIISDPYDEQQQTRKQKVVKLCTNQNGETKNSLRIGWCYDPKIDKIRLAFYAHINHLEGIYGNEPGREQCYLEKEINSNEWCHVEMAIGKKGMFMSIDGQSVIVSRNIYSWSPNGEKTYVRAFSYFEYKNSEGKVKGAVQDMDMYIKNAYSDLPNFVWENENCEYTADSIAFMNTHFEFAGQGPYSYYAGTRIYCSKKSASTVTNLPYNAPFTVIEPNINVSFTASESIFLDKGFHAKPGSHFNAIIKQVTQPATIYVLELPKYISNPVCYTVENANSFSMELYDWESMSILLDECQGSVLNNQACCNIGEELTAGKYWARTTFYNLCNTKTVEHIIKKALSDSIYNKYLSRASEKPDEGSSKLIIDENFQHSENSIYNNLKKENLSEEFFSVFPNPNPGIFNVELYNKNINNFTIEVTDIMGIRVYFRDNVSPGTMQIDIKDQAKGIYFVKIRAVDKTYIKKVVYR